MAVQTASIEKASLETASLKLVSLTSTTAVQTANSITCGITLLSGSEKKAALATDNAENLQHSEYILILNVSYQLSGKGFICDEFYAVSKHKGGGTMSPGHAYRLLSESF